MSQFKFSLFLTKTCLVNTKQPLVFLLNATTISVHICFDYYVFLGTYTCREKRRAKTYITKLKSNFHDEIVDAHVMLSKLNRFHKIQYQKTSVNTERNASTVYTSRILPVYFLKQRSVWAKVVL